MHFYYVHTYCIYLYIILVWYANCKECYFSVIEHNNTLFKYVPDNLLLNSLVT